MTHKHLLTVVLLSALLVQPVVAAERDATLEMRPACPHDLNDSETVFGPIPDVEGYVTLGDDTCPSFHVEDPETLRTNELRLGDTLAIDIIIDNPSRQPVNYIRSWLSYDPVLLEGISIEVKDAFPSVTPGEADFDVESGYAMIEASNDAGDANTVQYIRAATITFRVIGTSDAGTPITFYDVQPSGHTSVATNESGNDEEILSTLPGSVKVIFAAESESATTDEADTEAEEETNEGFDSLFDDQPSKLAPEPAPPVDPPAPAPEPDPTPQRTAFSLLQVRNLRLTTDGSSLFIGWDALNHQDLKAYNIYYGTTSGRYIQRKTIAGDITSLVLRALPIGETYYVAIRAVSHSDEESAFSQEASVEIGKPNSSTAPLILGSLGLPGPNGVNPVQGSVNDNGVVPGATGTSSIVAWLFILSAFIGTGIAFRRQSVLHTSQTV